MHELSLMESLMTLIETEARRQDVRAVRVVRLRVGELSCAEPEALRFCFPVLAAGTVAETARLEIERVPGQGWCEECAMAVALPERHLPCPGCGATGLAVIGGEQLSLAELEVV